MNSMVPLIFVSLYLSSTLTSVLGKQNTEKSKSSSPQIQFPAQGGTEQGTNGVNRFGGAPTNTGGTTTNRRTLGNGFNNANGNSNDVDEDYDYGNDSQGTQGTENDEESNGVFSNPWLGQRRRTIGSMPGYSSNGNGAQPTYGIPYMTGMYPGTSGFQSGNNDDDDDDDQGYIYPLSVLGGRGIGYGQPGGSYGLGQPGGTYGIGQSGGSYGSGQPGGSYSSGQPGGSYGYGQPGGSYGNGQPGGSYGYGQPSGMYGLGQQGGTYGLGGARGYGISPAIYRALLAGYSPYGGTSGVYGNSQSSYTPSLYGYGIYPGLGLEYGMLKRKKSNEKREDESGGKKFPLQPSHPGPAGKEDPTEMIKPWKKVDP